MFHFGLLLAAALTLDTPVKVGTIGTTLRAEPGGTNLWTLVGQVTAFAEEDVFLQDETGTAWIDFPEAAPAKDLSLGDRVRLRVRACYDVSQYRNHQLRCEAVETIGHAPVPQPISATLLDLNAGKVDCLHVRVRGVVADVFRDEIDPRYVFFMLQDEYSRTIACLKNCDMPIAEIARAYTDTAVEITGICFPCSTRRRQYEDRVISIGTLSDIRPLPPDAAAPFRFARRREISGTVCTTWNEGSLFLKMPAGDVRRIRLASGEPVPPPGAAVVIRGFNHTYTCFETYDNATVVSSVAQPLPAEKPAAVSPRTILFDRENRPRIDLANDGRLLTLEGLVTSVSFPGTDRGSFSLDGDGERITVVIGARPPPDVGARVAATGACLLQHDADDHGFIHLNGFSLVTRDESDVRVLEAAPWWTPQRLLMAIGLLLASLVGILIWNRILQHLVERRSRELLRSEIDKVTETLRLDERTRLAIELHDSISQNLTGVVFRLDACLDTHDTDPESALRNLHIATQMLHSCRVELRRCIWDLKSNALENPDLTDAIRSTLAPLLSTCELRVRFNVPRARLSDTTTHAVLRILRELTANAIAHGRARIVRIAGELSSGRLNISVTDDGSGFDPNDAPGPREGHFGIMGIRERVKRFKGTIDVTSAPGAGTRVKISIPAPQLDIHT